MKKLIVGHFTSDEIELMISTATIRMAAIRANKISFLFAERLTELNALIEHLTELSNQL